MRPNGLHPMDHQRHQARVELKGFPGKCCWGQGAKPSINSPVAEKQPIYGSQVVKGAQCLSEWFLIHGNLKPWTWRGTGPKWPKKNLQEKAVLNQVSFYSNFLSNQPAKSYYREFCNFSLEPILASFEKTWIGGSHSAWLGLLKSGGICHNQYTHTCT